MTSDKIIENLISLLTYYLDELCELPRNDFIHGEMTAYVDVLQVIQSHQDKTSDNLNYVIDKRYEI